MSTAGTAAAAAAAAALVVARVRGWSSLGRSLVYAARSARSRAGARWIDRAVSAKVCFTELALAADWRRVWCLHTAGWAGLVWLRVQLAAVLCHSERERERAAAGALCCSVLWRCACASVWATPMRPPSLTSAFFEKFLCEQVSDVKPRCKLWTSDRFLVTSNLKISGIRLI